MRDDPRADAAGVAGYKQLHAAYTKALAAGKGWADTFHLGGTELLMGYTYYMLEHQLQRPAIKAHAAKHKLKLERAPRSEP